MNNSRQRAKGSSRNNYSINDFYIHPHTGDIYDIYTHELVLENEKRYDGAPILVHTQTGQQYDPWTGNIIAPTPQQQAQIQMEEELAQEFYEQLTSRLKQKRKGTYQIRNFLHEFIIHPLTEDICDLSGKIVLSASERHENALPLVREESGQQYDPWSGEVLNLTPREILRLKQREEIKNEG